jgi:hypothetical protein
MLDSRSTEILSADSSLCRKVAGTSPSQHMRIERGVRVRVWRAKRATHLGRAASLMRGADKTEDDGPQCSEASLPPCVEI